MSNTQSLILTEAEQHENPTFSGYLAEALPEGEEGPSMEDLALARQIVSMATFAMAEIDKSLRPNEIERRKKLGLLTDQKVATLGGTLPERLFRTKDPDQQWQALMEVVSMVGIPEKMTTFEQTGLRIASSDKLRILPRFGIQAIMSASKRHILSQIEDFVRVFKNGNPENVVQQLEKESNKTNIGYELNLVTESARTISEARCNINWYQRALMAGAKRVAIKPTSLVPFSDSAIAKPSSKTKLKEALCKIFEVAERITSDGQESPIITIDSERSDIVDMVRDAFIEAAHKYPKVRVQIAIQAYLKDTETLMLDPLLEASKLRVANGGAPLGARLVNGANQKGEEAFSSLMGWEGTPLVESKPAAHANFMNLREKIAAAVKNGEFTLTIGSMNLLTLMHSLIGLAKAGAFAEKNGGFIHFAMLRGMTGQEIFRYLQAKYGIKGHEYIPCIPKKIIVELFKYYLRRIDELAGKKGVMANYLGVLAAHGINSPQWAQTQIKHGILAGLSHYRQEQYPLQPGIRGYRGDNEPTDLPESLKEFRPTPNIAPGSVEDATWIDDTIQGCEIRESTDAEAIDLHFEQNPDDTESREEKELHGPTRPDLVLLKYKNATTQDIDEAFKKAHEDKDGWGKISTEERIDKITKAVKKMKKNRRLLDQSLMLNSGKSILEADGEVNEAMDFLNLSGLQMKELLNRENLEFTTEGDGTAVVVCPKNFPQAIPAAHIAARLLAGYRVIVKPSGGEGEESVWTTYEMCKCFWEAGVPKDALIFLPCDNKKAEHLTKKAQRVGFTGSTNTAKTIRQNNKKLDFIGETGGRNFIIVDSTADLKAVATDVLRSVCGFAGQKCSKPIAVLATKDVDMEEFKKYLVGQLKEMLIATALTRQVDVTPLSRQYAQSDPLYQKVMNCLQGEEWLETEINTGLFDGNGREATRKANAKPQKMGDPGIRIIKDTETFDFGKIEEIFAPIVTIGQIDGGIDKAVSIINGLKGNLTGSLFSQNRDTINYALQNWKTGNLYINRGNTGAMAHQGFGDGVGDSHSGAHGAKTGTIEWLLANSCVKKKQGKHAKYDKVEEDETGLKKILERMEEDGVSTEAIHAGWSYLYEYENYFSKRRKAPYQTKGQYDWIESHNVGKIALRICEGDSIEEILMKIFATIAARNPLRISVSPKMAGTMTKIQEIINTDPQNAVNDIECVEEDDDSFIDYIEENKQDIGCILYIKKDNIPDPVFEKSIDASIHIDSRVATGDGLNDMITQFRQQSYCWMYHTAGDTTYEDFIGENYPEEVPYSVAA